MSAGKAVAVLLASVVMAAGVWYAVTRFPLAGSAPVDQAQPGNGRRIAAVAPAPPPPLPALGAVCGTRCGVERWAIKTMSDPSRDQVDLRPITTTVESLATILREPGTDFQRGPSAERHVFVIEGFLSGWRLESDRDYHVIVFGLNNQRLSLIGEIPHPQCFGACQSGFAEQFAQARAELERCVHQPNPRDRPIRVRVEGVGFFDREHGQSGSAPNQFELHPVLKLECL
jgi:hypothetical protein